MFRLALTISVSLFLSTFASSRAADVDFETQIKPIFLEHCSSCHGEKKRLGKLQLHTPESIQKRAAADEHLLIAGKPEESELYQRLVLPADHKKRMPKKADPLAKEKIDLIRLWIEQGASLPVATLLEEPAPKEEPNEEKPVEKPKRERLPLPEVASADAAAIEKLHSAGAQVMSLYADSPLLQVSFALRSSPAGDADVAVMAAVAEQIYSLNLAGSQASDEGLAVLAKLKNLAKLHLENSATTDDGLTHVAGLERLEYLNLYGTGITDVGIAKLVGLKHLEKLYLWKTKVSYEAAMDLEKQIPELIVELGYDHPVIARKRLTKQLEQAKVQVEEATANAEQVKQELERAKKSDEAAKKRLEEIQKEFDSLDGDSEPEKSEKTETDKPETDKPAEAEKPEEPTETDEAA